MTRRSPAPAAVAAVLLSACVSKQQAVENREDLLAAAGFTARPANTPQRLQALQTLVALVKCLRGCE